MIQISDNYFESSAQKNATFTPHTHNTQTYHFTLSLRALYAKSNAKETREGNEVSSLKPN